MAARCRSLGPGWRVVGGGEVSLAAFPTGVEPGARLVADGTTPAKAPRTLDAGARAVEIDVFLDPPRHAEQPRRADR